MKKLKGFTLIELLVVISIIGILAALAAFSFTGSQRQARDTTRKSDLRQYVTSLEAFANKNNGLYPSRLGSSGGAVIATLCGDLSISPCPNDPKYGIDGTTYHFTTNGSGSGTLDATKYVIWAALENTTDYWVVCSTGVTGAKPVSGWSTPATGICPL